MVYVIARHRGRRSGYPRIVIARRHLTNFRVQGIYNRSVFAALTKPWPGTENTRPLALKGRSRNRRHNLEPTQTPSPNPRP